MTPIRRLFRFRPRFALLLLACCGIPGCLFSLGGHGESAVDRGNVGNPGGGDPDTSRNPGGGVNRPVGRGYYTSDSPADSGRLNLDSVYTVKWRASDSAGPGQVRIFLYRDDTLVGPVVGSKPATGSYEWNLATMPNTAGYRLASGSGYRLRFVNESDGSKWDFGPRFSLYSTYFGKLELTAPALGAHVRGDSDIRIAWTWTGKAGGQVGLELYRDTALVWTLETWVPAAQGEFDWTLIPDGLPSGDNYRFRIFSTSDANIQQMGPAFTLAFPVLSGAYAFLHPAAGEIWVAGEPGQIQWTVTGNPGAYSGITLWRDSPRELVYGWTPGATRDYAGTWTVPADMAAGSYRFRIASLADTTLAAFSDPFLLRAAGALYKSGSPAGRNSP